MFESLGRECVLSPTGGIINLVWGSLHRSPFASEARKASTMNDFVILGEALDIADPVARRKYLDQACGDDTALRARVEEMLASEGLKSICDAVPESREDVTGHDDPLIGQSIGGVKLVRVISEGGMGRVYEGRQENPRRTVAVKLVKPGVATEKLLRRFEFEAQVLARLSHPGVAQIFAAGTHGEGQAAQPYFVMEYISGAKPLTQYAEDLKLSTHDRLTLFRKVCDAVAYGHQKGVIHRDLKPGNILVNASGEPKVIDFGIAKTTDSDMALTTLQTDVGRLIGTYQYMSPEQFDADPHAIDVRSDVYALGVILYELLTGQPPYDLKRCLVPEIGSIIRQQDPTPIATVNKTLRRDIGVIAGKCLEKDKIRRYGSASELASDVGRYLSGEPIAAVAPSLWDGVVRLARRHKAAAAAVFGVAVSLVLTVAAVSLFYIRAEHARKEADEQRCLATVAREAEAEQRRSAEQSTAVAQAEGYLAKRRLYVASLYKLMMALATPQRLQCKKAYEEARDAYLDVKEGTGALPCELQVLGTELDGSVSVITGHRGAVVAVAYSPEGSRVVTASDDAVARIWGVSTGDLLVTMRDSDAPVLCVAFSPDGRLVATGAGDSIVRLFDAETGDVIRRIKVHGAPVSAIAFSHDGSCLATGSLDAQARIVDVETGDLLGTLNGHTARINSVCFSPDGRRLATASDDATARVWDGGASGPHAEVAPLVVLDGHVLDVTSVCFSPDGKRIATGGTDATVRLWDAETFAAVAVMRGHERRVTAVAFSPDGRRIATGSFDTTARLWDANTYESLAILKGHDNLVIALAYSPDGRQLATGSRDATARIWSVASPNPLAVLSGHRARLNAICFSPGGRRVATASDDGTAQLWDAATAEPIAIFKGHAGDVTSASFHPDGRLVATGSADSTVRLWDAETSATRAVLKGDGSRVTSVAFSRDGSQLVAGSFDGNVRLWSVKTGKELRVFPGHGASVNSVCFSPDGMWVATASEDGTASLRNAVTGQEIIEFRNHEGPVNAICFSPDGSLVATASDDGTARLWNAANGNSHMTLAGHRGDVTSVQFSSDGRRVATGSIDASTCLWNSETGELLVELDGQSGNRGMVSAVAFGPNGDRVATAYWGGTARLWGLGNAVAHANRHDSAERRRRLSPIVGGWFAGDGKDVKSWLAEAVGFLSADDWHEASNMVLERSSREPAPAAVERNSE
jgi:WD40 repeat protein/serine/threonine-protein kinase RIO1